MQPVVRLLPVYAMVIGAAIVVFSIRARGRRALEKLDSEKLDSEWDKQWHSAWAGDPCECSVCSRKAWEEQKRTNLEFEKLRKKLIQKYAKDHRKA